MGKGYSKQRSSESAYEIIRNELEFQEMVRMRKEEWKIKTEIRRSEVVKSLEEKKLRIEDEAKTKLFGLPDQIWENILAEVANPMDLWNVWGVHPKFRHLSGESQTQECLLSQVLRIEELPHLWENKKTRLSTLKTFRTVSNGMRASVDHLIEEDFMKALKTPALLRPSFHFKFDLKQMEFFDQRISVLTNGKRIFPRSLYLKLDYYEMELDRFVKFRNNVTSLLELVGKDIWYFEFDFAENHPQTQVLSMNEAYSLLVHWISLLPNLKWLELNFRIGNLIRQKDAITQETFDHFPFPHLSFLERIGFSNVRPRFEFVSAVILPNLQIKSLCLTGTYRAKHSFYRKMKPILSLLNLDEFEDYSISFVSFFEDIMQPLFSTTWKLKSFIFARNFSSDPDPDPKTVFTFLNSISTLEHLHLDFGKISLGKKIPRLNLPHLRHFTLNFCLDSFNFNEVENVIFFTSLQFLIHSKKLMSILGSFLVDSNISLDPLGHLREFLNKHEKNEMIKFRCGLADLVQSNIWDVFPELEDVWAVAEVIPRDLGHEKKIRRIRKPKLLRIK